ncbi:MAG: DUF2849 domain-containing protein [Pseudomonadota bacterium]
MTSVRPKLKPDQTKGITAWETITGDVIWMRSDGSWTKDPSEIGAFTGEAADAALAAAFADEAYVTDPYFMQVSETGAIEGRELLRETIRAKGPTSHPKYAKA